MGGRVMESTVMMSVSGKGSIGGIPSSPIFSQIQQQQQQQHQQRSDEAVSFRCRKKAVSWGASTVDNEAGPKKIFHKELYFSRVFEVNSETYMGFTPGSMQMRLVKRT